MNKLNKKGISLIVLVITIIVMIVLAAAIILSLQSSGIIGKANEAKAKTDVANAKQVVAVADAEWKLDEAKIRTKYDVDTFKEYASKKLEDAGYKIEEGEGSIEVDEDGTIYSYPVIPDGFIASPYEGENKILTGLVIYEASSLSGVEQETAQETYNQYVWVPVQNMNEFILKDWKKGVSMTKTKSYDLNSTEEAADYASMKESIEKHGGFYIARYEAGIPDGKTLETVALSDKPVSKKNASAWISIRWADAKANSKTTSTDSVEGHLIYGEEWDATLAFISKTDANYPIDSTGKGWYYTNYSSGNPQHLTGIDVNTDKLNMRNNIYDMAGNIWEWTIEWYSDTYRIKRGGSYGDLYNWKDNPASNRVGNVITSTGSGNGFRVALYIK